jgi:hypothetical protein
MDGGFINGLLFMDLTKAFDTIDYKILIWKLELYGINGKARQWFINFISYLTGKKQAYKINREISNTTHINCGVPQRSILGPLLYFSCYTSMTYLIV